MPCYVLPPSVSLKIIRLISRDVGIVYSKKINGYYMVAFLCSTPSKKQLETLSSGIVQAYLSTDQVESVFLPVPNIKIQDFAGTKFETAVRCRSETLNLQARISTLLSKLYKDVPYNTYLQEAYDSHCR